MNNKTKNSDKKITINKSLCIGCGSCEAVCPHDAIIVNSKTGKSEVNYAKCKLCKSCISVCPMQCIKLVSNKK